MDLRQSLAAYAAEHALQAAVVLSGVGSLSHWRVRCADGRTIHEAEAHAEIVSLQGTLSMHGMHLHISLAQEDLSVIGGHLATGCIVHTTAEIVLLAFSGTCFLRAYDNETGYKELTIEEEG